MNRLAVVVVSATLGETDGPWDEVCPRNTCDHTTCEVIGALDAAGLLVPTEGEIPASAVRTFQEIAVMRSALHKFKGDAP